MPMKDEIERYDDEWVTEPQDSARRELSKRRPLSLADRTKLFFAKVRKSEQCWFWAGSKTQNGYGQFYNGVRKVLAHRWIYELTVGPIPQDREIDHLCRTRNCVNPSHLRLATRRENTLAGETIAARNLKKTACPHGHPYDSSNGLKRLDGGGRECLACRQERNRRRREQTAMRRKEAAHAG